MVAGCPTRASDWGADTLTATLALRRETAHDAAAVPALRMLLARLPRYAPPCAGAPCAAWSDVPLWDAVAALQAGRATGDVADARRVARAAFARVARARVYALGACPGIDYQQPFGGANRLKTLETDANYVRAALLLHAAGEGGALVRDARAHYATIRRWFLQRDGLYTVYLFDDGRTCRPLPGRTFASVNGIMIWNGLELARATGDGRYRGDALATARAVAARLDDGAGVFANLQAENDVAEPLVEAMLRVAREQRAAFARDWILRNARAAAAARDRAGDYARFFDGPAPRGPVTAWQVNGGFAVEVAAAALAPHALAAPRSFAAGSHAGGFALGVGPYRLGFTGSGIALYGTLGERCCEAGHARVFVDGVEPVDRTGIWQNKSSAGLPLRDALLFAWRWPARGRHVLTFAPGVPNAKEGGSYLHVRAVTIQK